MGKAARLVTDDFGARRRLWRCEQCVSWLESGAFGYYPSGTRRPTCGACQSTSRRKRKVRERWVRERLVNVAPSAVSVTDELRRGEVARRCPQCQRWRPLATGFRVKAFTADGLVRYFSSDCGPCLSGMGERWFSVPRPTRNPERTNDEGVVERWCKGCESWKVRTGNFSPRRRKEGRIVQWRSYCCGCTQERQNTYRAQLPAEYRHRLEAERWKRIKADPERLERKRATSRGRPPGPNRPEVERRYRANLHADPERLERKRETNRMAYRLRKEQDGTVVTRNYDVVRQPLCEYLPVGPFREWLEMQVKLVGVDVVAARCGVVPRTVFRWRFETQWIEEETVDRAGIEFSEPWLLAVLYGGVERVSHGQVTRPVG